MNDIDTMAIEERDHIENLLVSRFHFFVAFFSAVIAGAIASLEKFPSLSVIILITGFIILCLIRETIVRCQVKLNIIIKYFLPEQHTNNKVEQIIKGIQDPNQAGNFAEYDEIMNKIEKGEAEDKSVKELVKKIKKSKSQRNIIGFTIPYVCLGVLVLATLANIAYIVHILFK